MISRESLPSGAGFGAWHSCRGDRPVRAASVATCARANTPSFDRETPGLERGDTPVHEPPEGDHMNLSAEQRLVRNVSTEALRAAEGKRLTAVDMFREFVAEGGKRDRTTVRDFLDGGRAVDMRSTRLGMAHTQLWGALETTREAATLAAHHGVNLARVPDTQQLEGLRNLVESVPRTASTPEEYVDAAKVGLRVAKKLENHISNTSWALHNDRVWFE